MVSSMKFTGRKLTELKKEVDNSPYKKEISKEVRKFLNGKKYSFGMCGVEDVFPECAPTFNVLSICLIKGKIVFDCWPGEFPKWLNGKHDAISAVKLIIKDVCMNCKYKENKKERKEQKNKILEGVKKIFHE